MPSVNLRGVDIRYEVQGEGTAVVFVPGFATNLHLFDHQAGPVSTRYRAVRFDLRGHGQSSAPPEGYSTAEYAEDLVALMEHLNLGRAHIVAASMGGAIAVRLALRRPELVRSLVLAGAVIDGFEGWSEEYRSRLRRARKLAQTEGVAAAVADWKTHPFFAATRDLAAFFRVVLETSGASWLQRGRPEAPGVADIDRLREIEKPTLVVVGEKDVDPCKEIADALVRLVPGARRVVIAGAGHLPCWDQPEAFNRALLEFLAAQAPPAR
ncbi:MAG TPA: alpha/beta fold hydrolase [Candidatus Thermoplasmatota archaeon]